MILAKLNLLLGYDHRTVFVIAPALLHNIVGNIVLFVYVIKSAKWRWYNNFTLLRIEFTPHKSLSFVIYSHRKPYISSPNISPLAKMGPGLSIEAKIRKRRKNDGPGGCFAVSVTIIVYTCTGGKPLWLNRFSGWVFCCKCLQIFVFYRRQIAVSVTTHLCFEKRDLNLLAVLGYICFKQVINNLIVSAESVIFQFLWSCSGCAKKVKETKEKIAHTGVESKLVSPVAGIEPWARTLETIPHTISGCAHWRQSRTPLGRQRVWYKHR